MKTQILTSALLLVTLSFTSCKKNEVKTTQNHATTEPTAQVDASKQVQDTIAKTKEEANEKSSGKREQQENQENEKNDRD